LNLRNRNCSVGNKEPLSAASPSKRKLGKLNKGNISPAIVVKKNLKKKKGILQGNSGL
jgi:hypothetical protein